MTTKRLGVRNLAHKYGLGYSFIYFACLSTFLARSIARLESWQCRPLRGIICSGWGLFSIVISDRFARDGDDGLHARTYIYIYMLSPNRTRATSSKQFQTAPKAQERAQISYLPAASPNLSPSACQFPSSSTSSELSSAQLTLNDTHRLLQPPQSIHSYIHHIYHICAERTEPRRPS